MIRETTFLKIQKRNQASWNSIERNSWLLFNYTKCDRIHLNRFKIDILSYIPFRIKDI